MRVFIGIKTTAVLPRVAEVRTRFGYVPVRWVLPENLHITVVPPWNERDPHAVAARIAPIVERGAPFTITFTSLGLGPGGNRPRLIWAYGVAPAGLVKLRRVLVSELHLPEARRIKECHLTLARFREEDVSHLPVGMLKEKINWQEPVFALAVIKSQCLPEGARHEVISLSTLSAKHPL